MRALPGIGATRAASASAGAGVARPAHRGRTPTTRIPSGSGAP